VDEYIKLVYEDVSMTDVPSDGFSIVGVTWETNRRLTINAGGPDATNRGKQLKVTMDDALRSEGVLTHVHVSEAGCRTGADIKEIKEKGIDVEEDRNSFRAKDLGEDLRDVTASEFNTIKVNTTGD
jgi:hypothetical protein